MTYIIHNAWSVNFNFNLPLDTFRPQLTGLVNLFSLSASARYQPQVFFVSSISSVLGLRTTSRLTLEEIIADTNAPFKSGYAESKFVSEILCDEAARYLDIPVSVARVGQIAGPVRRRGIWNPVEWIPSLVMSSVHLSALPDSVGASLNKVDWMPVDLLSETIVDLVIHHDRSMVDAKGATKPVTVGAEVFHLQNPRSTTWSTLLPTMRSALELLTSKPIAIVPVKHWLAMVMQRLKSVSKDENLETQLRLNPAAKLLEFFSASMLDTEGTNVLDLEKTLDKSARLRDMDGVNPEWIRKWVAEWLSI